MGFSQARFYLLAKDREFSNMKKGISKNQLSNVLMIAIVNKIWGFHNELKDYIAIIL